MFEQTFKNIDDVLWKEAGCATELDYTEQTSWILFLKYLDDLEKANEQKAELQGRKYEPIIETKYRWSAWAAPKKKDGSFDHDKALTGDDLIKYVDEKLFRYLKGFRTRAEAANTIEYKIGEIFGEIENKFRSGYSLRDALELVDGLSFKSQEQKHELSHLYEAKLRNMGNAGRNGGEYYTPRPLIRSMIKVMKPEIGERIYDGACGSAGFLCEAYDYLRAKPDLSTKDLKVLQERTFFGKEKKSLAYVIGIMNMILHGIEAPNIVHTNTLAENISDIQEKDRYHIVLANPPFGGKERPEVQQNFEIRTGETAFLFLQHFIKSLKAGGRAAIVIKNTFLSNTDNAAVALRKELLESCNLHTVLDMPGGTFLGAGVKTVVLFFEKGSTTRKIWFYKCDPGRNLGKTNPLNDDDLKEFVALQAKFKNTDNSWTVDRKSIDSATYDLSVRNPNKVDEAALREPIEPVIPKPMKADDASGDPDEPGGDEKEPKERPKTIRIKLADGKERAIQHMMATSYWSPDGRPISANQMIEQLFGELPRFFKDEDELRRLWSKPDTRKALLGGLADKGFGSEQLGEISRMISAEKSDIFDVLAYIAFALAPITREQRVAMRRSDIFAKYDTKLKTFLDFVLGQYVAQGVGELDQEKLGPLLELKYHTIDDAARQLGSTPVIRDAFLGFQQHLYAANK